MARYRDGHRRFDPNDAATPEVAELYVRLAVVAAGLDLLAGIGWILTALLFS